MVQEFYILKCCTCDFFQVHIVKKAKTWVCKLCGLKQSIIKVYGQGSAKECRINVQNLNEKCQSRHDSIFENVAVNAYNNPDEDFSQPPVLEDDKSTVVPATEFIRERKSKWSAYLEDEPERTHAPKKCKRDYSTDDANKGIAPLRIFESRSRDSNQCSANRSRDRILSEWLGVEPAPEQCRLSRLRTTEELLTSLTASSDSNAVSLSPVEDHDGGDDVQYFTREVCESKADDNCIENFSTIKSTYSKTQVTKIPASLVPEDDIDSILEL